MKDSCWGVSITPSNKCYFINFKDPYYKNGCKNLANWKHKEIRGGIHYIYYCDIHHEMVNNIRESKIRQFIIENNIDSWVLKKLILDEELMR